MKALWDITSITYPKIPNMELRRPALVSAAFPRSQGCCMGLGSPKAPAANGWGLLTSVYIPVLRQRGLKTLGKPFLLLDLSFCFCKMGVGCVDSKAEVRSTIAAHKGEGWAGGWLLGAPRLLSRVSDIICLSSCPFPQIRKPQVVSDQYSVPNSMSQLYFRLVRASCPLLHPDPTPGKEEEEGREGKGPSCCIYLSGDPRLPSPELWTHLGADTI